MQPAKRVIFISQRQAEKLTTLRSAAMLSITDPSAPLASLKNWKAPLLRVAFHDADPLTFPGANPELLPLTLNQADNIAQFVLSYSGKAQRFVVHCRSGVSRSAGVAKAVAEHWGVPFPPTYNEYNRYVYELIRDALLARVNIA